MRNVETLGYSSREDLDGRGFERAKGYGFTLTDKRMSPTRMKTRALLTRDGTDREVTLIADIRPDGTYKVSLLTPKAMSK